MKVLSAETLSEALELCDKRPGTEIGIACSGEMSAQDFNRLLRSEIYNNRLSGWGVNIFSGCRTFTKMGNGFCDRSSISVFSAYEPTLFRGMRFHQILFESDIDEQVLGYLVQCEKPHKDDIEDEFSMSDSLSMFLSSFKII